MQRSAPRIVFVSLSDDIGSERIVSEMGRRGAVCAVLARKGSTASLSRFVAHHHVLPSRGGVWGAAFMAARRLDAFSEAWHPDQIVPLDDMASQILRDIALSDRTREPLRNLLRRSLGDPRSYRTASRRAALVEAAADLGLRTPGQHQPATLAGARAGAASLGYPLLLKRESSCGGGGVSLVRDDAELLRVFRAANRKARTKRLLRRLCGFRPAEDDPPISLQAFVTGRLAVRSVACAAGRVLDGFSLLAETLDPPVTGSSTVVRPIENVEMDDAARRVVAALGCSGFVSFDFLVDDDGRATLIEMNARPVGSGHLGARFGHDIYGRWLDSLAGVAEAPRRAAAASCSVALFPKEMRRDPGSPALAPGAAALHDVPWDEPRVVAAYRDLLLRHHPDRAGTIGRRLRAEEMRVSRDVVVPFRREISAP